MENDNDVGRTDGSDRQHDSNTELTANNKTDLTSRIRGIQKINVGGLRVFRDAYGEGYMQVEGHRTVYRLDGPHAAVVIRQLAAEVGQVLRPHELKALVEDLKAIAQIADDVEPVWLRVAPFRDGVEIYIGDGKDTRVCVTPGQVAIVRDGGGPLFHRPPTMRPMCIPAESGDLERLKKFINLSAIEFLLLKAWLGYTLAHPKSDSSKFLILLLTGEQGSGKSLLCRLIKMLIDPSTVDVQSLPGNVHELAIAVQSAHVTVFDNLRALRPSMSDALCVVATGGTLPKRKLFTNDEIVPLRMHGSVVLNAIHTPADQPDLVDRCLPLTLQPLDPTQRRDEATLLREFQDDLPFILRGLLDLIAGVLMHLPTVTTTDPERMVDFSRWLAAMERVDAVPVGVYQGAYSSMLNDGMLDGLLEDPLAAAVMDLVGGRTGPFWSGTPADLFDELGDMVSRATTHSREWTRGPIAMSKRLKSLQAALRRQRVDVRWTRGKNRIITITRGHPR